MHNMYYASVPFLLFSNAYSIDFSRHVNEFLEKKRCEMIIPLKLLADHTYLSEIEYVSLNADGHYSQLQDIFFIHDVFFCLFSFLIIRSRAYRRLYIKMWRVLGYLFQNSPFFYF